MNTVVAIVSINSKNNRAPVNTQLLYFNTHSVKIVCLVIQQVYYYNKTPTLIGARSRVNNVLLYTGQWRQVPTGFQSLKNVRTRGVAEIITYLGNQQLALIIYIYCFKAYLVVLYYCIVLQDECATPTKSQCRRIFNYTRSNDAHCDICSDGKRELYTSVTPTSKIKENTRK